MVNQISKNLPLIICGKRVDRAGSFRQIEFPAGNVSIPSINESIVDKIVHHAYKEVLADIPLHEIVSFIYNVGQNWKSRDYVRRRLYIRDLVNFLGYSEKMAELEANWIAMTMSSHAALYDIIDVELGNRHIIDDWVHSADCYVRAFPRGLTLHALAGNVPLAGLTSILRAIITKNHVVVKSSSTDPFTPIAIAQSFQDVDPTHCLTRALSILHWPGGKEGCLEEKLLEASSALCVWGGRSAVRWAAKYFSDAREVIVYGPKRSVAVVDCRHDISEAARRVAHDVCHYDQRACFSVQNVFVIGDKNREYINYLSDAMSLYACILPKGFHNIDENAGQRLLEREALFEGLEARLGENGSWLIVDCEPQLVAVHPLGRTILLTYVDCFESVVSHLSPDVQTVSLHPWSSVFDVRDLFARAGVSRIVEAGMNNIFRPGTAHDSMYPLQRMVRFAACEFPSEYRFKAQTVQIDQTFFLEKNKFLEFVP